MKSLKSISLLRLRSFCCLLLLVLFLGAFYPRLALAADSQINGDNAVVIHFTNQLIGNLDSSDNIGFTFELTPEQTSAPMPRQSVVSVEGSKQSSFGTIVYNRPGVFSYLMKSKGGTNANIVYDTRVFRITVVAVNSDSGIVAEVAAVADAETNDKLEDIVVINSVKSPSQRPPLTGDELNTIVIAALVFMCVAGAVFIRRRKRNEAEMK